ncbi:MAG: excinuclease ABC subunit UvrA [Phycisphaeraceae bacterium]|nr:excinuclease ABC subunit UvrA [Phycisphaeraceae bacterium]
MRSIRVRGAREHNLKNIDLAIPRDRLIVMTGLSGSGKSSLAFDTIFAEGQRKYMESLSAYARQFLDQIRKPDVDEVEGIPPTIAIEQRSASSNPRSTVATTTEIYDYLRLLYARCGRAFSWAPSKAKKDGTVLARRGVPISATSAPQIVDAVLGRGDGARALVLAPVVSAKKGFHKDVLEDLQRQGWGRARVNGTVIELREALKEGGENPLKLGRYQKHDVEAVIDRLVIKGDDRQRLAEAIEGGLRVGQGRVIVSVEDGERWQDLAFSTALADPEFPEYALPELEPRLFSFNSPQGACPTCHGLGTLLEFDEALVIPDESLSLQQGAAAAWNKNGPVRAWYNRKLRRFCKEFGASFTQPVSSFSPELRHALLHGARAEGKRGVKFEGVIPNIQQWWTTTENPSVKEWLSGFMSDKACPECLGDRLRIEALHLQLTSGHRAEMSRARSENVIGRPIDDGSMLNIAELSRLTISDALAFMEALELTREQQRIAEPIVREVGNRLRFLMSVGLEYLSLDRRTGTLSGGEAQRIRLATQVGSGLVGACYVLDEPTIGLHARDNTRLITTLRRLADIGNTVIVVEHDREMIEAADHLVDVGPGAGVHGGRIVAQGSIADLCDEPESVTGEYLSGRRTIETPAKRRKLSDKRAIAVKGARENNLRSIDVSFPLGGLVAVTGVSGSGKSTLVNEILLKAARRELHGARVIPGAHTRLTGLKQVDRVIEVDQSPIGRTPRSNPATYTGIFDDIRALFAQSREAKIRGYKPGRFSFNVSSANGGGRCEACQGQGLKKIEMHFLADVYVECEVCAGKRYNRETLEVLYRGKNISHVLDMTVEDACGFFESHPKVLRFVECLRDVGLGYITLGQPSTTLSGGEAQRVKLATELGKGGGTKNNPGAYANCLYVLDEPTTGLHFEDVRKLLIVLHRLVEAGNTVVVIEHNLDVVKSADWIIDLGPEGGAGGGTVIATGTPEQVARVVKSYTGEYLKPVLST